MTLYILYIYNYILSYNCNYLLFSLSQLQYPSKLYQLSRNFIFPVLSKLYLSTKVSHTRVIWLVHCFVIRCRHFHPNGASQDFTKTST